MGSRILIVEDDARIRLSLQLVLEEFCPADDTDGVMETIRTAASTGRIGNGLNGPSTSTG